MSVLPVIIRELRSQARQPLTHWLRLIGGISVVGAIAMALWAVGVPSTNVGRAGVFANPVQTFGTVLFGKMNSFIFAAIWLFVPLATADAVSRERREGTLALLYLTELGSAGIVVGKVFVHLLRSVSLFLAMAPWLILPLVFGGLALNDFAMALLLDFTAVLLAQAAGLLASTFPRDWLKSVILAELFALALLLAMLSAHGAVLSKAVTSSIPAGVSPGTPAFWSSPYSPLWEFYSSGRSQSGIIERTSRLFELTTNASVRDRYTYGFFGGGAGPAKVETEWQQFWALLPPAGQAFWFHGVIEMVAGAALVLVAATLLGAWRVERSWQDAPPHNLVAELRRKFLVPRFRVQSLNRSLARALTANPIGWLHLHSPSARMVKWGWCLFIMLAEIVFSQDPSDAYEAQAGLGLILLLGLAFSATGSFREELATGAFELLLVTPLRERQIIIGRVRGLWRQFLPAILIYVAGNVYLASGWSDQHARDAGLMLTRTIAAFCALPLIGLYFSVQRRNFFVSWLAACFIGLLPAALGRAFGATELSMIVLQLGVAIAAAFCLERRLKNREILQKQA